MAFNASISASVYALGPPAVELGRRDGLLFKNADPPELERGAVDNLDAITFDGRGAPPRG